VKVVNTEQPVRLNTVQYAVSHGHLELQKQLYQIQFRGRRCDAVTSHSIHHVNCRVFIHDFTGTKSVKKIVQETL